MKGQFQLGSGRAIIQRVVVTELATSDSHTVMVVLGNGRKHVRVPHEVDLVGGDEPFRESYRPDRSDRRLAKGKWPRP
jgi:hypothetical protein